MNQSVQQKPINFKFLEDLIYYDGSLVSIGLCENNLPVLQIWCDINEIENYHTYAYAYLNKKDLYPFLNGEKSYLAVLKNCEKIITFKCNEQFFNFQTMDNSSFIQQYGPTEDITFNHDLLDTIAIVFESFINYKTHDHYLVWKTNPPPKETLVWASYDIDKNDWQQVKTCKRGCCVSSDIGTMLLPNFWHLPNPLEKINT